MKAETMVWVGLGVAAVWLLSKRGGAATTVAGHQVVNQNTDLWKAAGATAIVQGLTSWLTKPAAASIGPVNQADFWASYYSPSQTSVAAGSSADKAAAAQAFYAANPFAALGL